MLCCSIWFPVPSFWMGSGLESRCVVRVYGANGAVRRHHPHRKQYLLQIELFILKLQYEILLKSVSPENCGRKDVLLCVHFMHSPTAYN